MPKETFMDITDRKLLMLLQKDSSIPSHELGSKVGLSTSAVNERVRRLFNEKIITGAHARVNPKKVDLTIATFISISIDNPENNEQFLKRVGELPEILECHHVTGEYSFLLKALVRDTDHLEQLLTKGLKAAKGVISSQTMLILSSPKELPIVDCLNDMNNKKDK